MWKGRAETIHYLFNSFYLLIYSCTSIRAVGPPKRYLLRNFFWDNYCWSRPLSDAFVMLSYRAVSHFNSQASVFTRTLSEAECSKNRWLKIALLGVKKLTYLCIYFSTEMSQARFTESCVLTGFFKHFKGANFVASGKTHWLTSVASTDDFTRSQRKKRALVETLNKYGTYLLWLVYLFCTRYSAAAWKSSNTFCLFPSIPPLCHVSPYSLRKKQHKF